MQIKHQFSYQVLPQEVDAALNLRQVALESYLLNVAGIAAEKNGFGATGLIANGVTWVLSRFSIEMHEMPRQYETFTIETWVEDYGRLLTTRNFRIYAQDGHEIGQCISQWAVLDIQTRRPVNLQQFPEYAEAANGEGVEIEKPARIAAVNPEISIENKRRVVYSDIDFNRHTNSMKYLEWALDTLDAELLYTKPVKRLDINYLHEALIGEQVTLLTQQTDDCVIIEISTPTAVAARIQLQF